MRSALTAGCARSRVSVVLGWAARGRAVTRQTSAHAAPDDREWNPMAGLLDEDVAGWLWEVLRVESITALSPGAARRRSGGFVTEPRHQPEQPVLGGLGAGDFAHQAPGAQHQDPVGEAQDFGELTRDEQDGVSLLGQLPAGAVHLRLAAHVHAAGGLVEDQRPGARGGPPRQGHLLLGPARETGDDRLGTRRPGPEPDEVLQRHRALGRAAEPGEPGETLENGE